MSRIGDCFTQLAGRRRTAFIPYLVAGDPHPEWTVRLMHLLVKTGADLIELGVPFSDPMADGKVIQRGHERALMQGTSLSKVLRMVAAFRSDDETTPIVLMGYLNPVEAMGYEVFAQAARNAGVDGVLLIDLPPEAADQCHELLQSQCIEQIFLLAPNTSRSRIARIATLSGGYVYYVSLQGVTGSAKLHVPDVARHLAQLREQIHVPIAVGFGVQDAQHAVKLSGICDAVVVGSAIVDRIARYGQDETALFPALTHFLSDIRQALDQGSQAA